MKKKLIVLAATALFSVGLAFYANNSKIMNVLSDSNVEALTGSSDGGNGGNTYTEFGTYPHRVWVDNITHTLTLEGYRKVKNEEGKYECMNNQSYTCASSSASPVYIASEIVDMIKNLIGSLLESNSFFSWIKGLFGK